MRVPVKPPSKVFLGPIVVVGGSGDGDVGGGGNNWVLFGWCCWCWRWW